MIGFYNRDEKCLQRGTDWVFKYKLCGCCKYVVTSSWQNTGLNQEVYLLLYTVTNCANALQTGED